jgi:chromate transporter
MSSPLHLVLGWSEWIDLFAHFMLLSLMSVGGAISTSSEMHRYLVEQHHWLTQAQFAESIALAQAAPGPNVLFVALMGWHVGMNTGSTLAALLGVATTMFGIMIPSSVLTYSAAQWGHRNSDLRAVRAFKQGLAPIVIALLLATSWILAAGLGEGPRAASTWLLVFGSGFILWRTRLHMLWLLAVGAVLGGLQLV